MFLVILFTKSKHKDSIPSHKLATVKPDLQCNQAKNHLNSALFSVDL